MSGIDNIIRRIIDQANSEAENIIKEAEEYKKQKLAEAEEKGKALLQKTIEELETEEKNEINKAKSAALLKNKRILLEAKEKIIEKVFNQAKEEISKKINSKEYPKILTKFIVEGAISLNSEEIFVQLPKQHQNVALDLDAIANQVSKETGISTKIQILKEPIRSIGGAVIKNKDNTKWVDNTIEERFNRFDKTIRSKIISLLFD